MTDKSTKPWYKKWWGIILAVLLLPYFLIWFVWAKTRWARPAKVWVTVGLVIMSILSLPVLGAFESTNTQPTQLTTTTTTSSQITPSAPRSTPNPTPTPATNTSHQATKPPTKTATATPVPMKPATSIATRKASGTATTLGAGTFTGGTAVAVGLYDVTTRAGQSGNFIVNGTDSYNEILGTDGSNPNDVPKIRVQISNSDQIQISSLSSVTFKPVTTAYVTSHTTTSLYAGTFIVGQDIGAGRYVVTPGTGQSGNFIVSGNDDYNEILGRDSSMGEVPNVTVTLTDDDVLAISGMSQVTLTASN